MPLPSYTTLKRMAADLVLPTKIRMPSFLELDCVEFLKLIFTRAEYMLDVIGGRLSSSPSA